MLCEALLSGTTTITSCYFKDLRLQYAERSLLYITASLVSKAYKLINISNTRYGIACLETNILQDERKINQIKIIESTSNHTMS